MRGRNAKRARAEFRLYAFVCDDFYMERHAAEFKIVFLSDEFLVARIIRMHGNGHIADFRFRARGAYGNREVLRIFKRVEL
jgi:hypothetical protein